MNNLIIKNAVIKSTSLGIEDYGVLTFFLYLDYGGSGQGFGGYGLDDYDKEKDKRVGTRFGCEAILRVLQTLEISNWEQLPGTSCRAKGTLGKINKIGHYLKDQWVDLEEIAKECGL